MITPGAWPGARDLLISQNSGSQNTGFMQGWMFMESTTILVMNKMHP